jgi:small subunit ribosomal protein S16
MVKLRLKRMGSINKPFYRIVTLDSRKKRDGIYLESIGYYDPKTDPFTLKVDVDRALYWLGVGAQPSDTVRSLLKKAGVMEKFHNAKLGEKEVTEEEVKKPAKKAVKKAKPAKKEETEKEEKKPVKKAVKKDKEDATEEKAVKAPKKANTSKPKEEVVEEAAKPEKTAKPVEEAVVETPVPVEEEVKEEVPQPVEEKETKPEEETKA